MRALALVALLSLTGWLIALQAWSAGLDRRPVLTGWAQWATPVLAGVTAVLALPQIYLLMV